MTNKTEKATFAGGCFWCMQPPYKDLKGVQSVTVGYTGGGLANPTYEQVCDGTTGHAEAVEIVFDPAQTSYEDLLDIFWKNINPTTLNSQFADRGTQYRTAIFYHSDEQIKAAEAAKERLRKSGKFDRPIVTEITPASVFYAAEDAHQDYATKCPARYGAYKVGSGRAGYLEKTWGKD
jgi:peptide methionine sulfoxide reductase msrA/msrB